MRIFVIIAFPIKGRRPPPFTRGHYSQNEASSPPNQPILPEVPGFAGPGEFLGGFPGTGFPADVGNGFQTNLGTGFPSNPGAGFPSDLGNGFPADSGAGFPAEPFPQNVEPPSVNPVPETESPDFRPQVFEIQTEPQEDLRPQVARPVQPLPEDDGLIDSR